MAYPRIASLKTADLFLNHLKSLGIDLPFDAQDVVDQQNSFAANCPSQMGDIGNRFCILPMEGWDGETDGHPTQLTVNRWKKFGQSGAKLIWGGEAVAVRPDGRANPNQLMLNDRTASSIEGLKTALIEAHLEQTGSDAGLLIGLQLTHSGRFARPNAKTQPEPRIAYRHPILDGRVGISDDSKIMSDDELKSLIEEFVRAAVMAQKLGYHFVDIKHCHGYLGHELLSGYDRQGEFGGSFENRTKFLRDIVAGIRAEAPGLQIGVRLSIFDFVPFKPGEDRIGVPAATGDYPFAFGGDGTGTGINLSETSQLLELFKSLGIELLCTTAGTPYSNPHILRPAYFPPSDGYLPPEDPLVGVARQIHAAAELKRRHPELLIVGSGYSYLQEWIPNVGHAVIREGMADFIGLGRMVLSYPELPHDAILGQTLARKKICRTFSDCTTAPRNGLISGCYPLDPDYKNRPEREILLAIKKETSGVES